MRPGHWGETLCQSNLPMNSCAGPDVSRSSIDERPGCLAPRLDCQAGCERPTTRTSDRATRRVSASQGMARSTRERTLAYTLTQLSDVLTSPEWAKVDQEGPIVVTALERAARLEVDAMQASYHEWDRIRSWKDRVRGINGQARLCGSWQWIIHNHQQNHREQKLSLLFPPAGQAKPALPGLVETVVLGENVYLRWETNGQVQEDSLQFSKEGQRLEGSFVNSQGGWGSISGKRTAGCTP